MSSRKTNTEYQTELDKKYGNIILIDEYKAYNKSALHKCTTCNFKWRIIPSNALHKHVECPKCRVDRLRAEYLSEFNSKWPDIALGYFNKPRDIVSANCICGNIWSDKLSLINFYGCPECKKVKNTDDIYNDGRDGIFYKLLFTHNKLDFKFIKIGITEQDVYKKYRNDEYADFSFDIILEYHTTINNARNMKLEFMRDNIDNRFYFPSDIIFNGYTECYMVDEMTLMSTKNLFVLRDSMIIGQGGICPLCENPIVSPVCDHEHTGKHRGDGAIRGVICSTCNSLLGSIENAVIRSGVGLNNKLTFINNLKSYIDKKHGTNYIYPSEKPKPKRLKKSSYNHLKRIAKQQGYNRKFPEYPKSKKLTVKLEELYKLYHINPEYYKKRN